MTITLLPPARAAALAALELCLPLKGKNGLDVQAALDQTLPRLCPDLRDRRLATELTYGYLRLKGRLDYLAGSLLAKPEKTPPFILRVLGLASYEILYLSHVPAHASLSWAVEAVKAKFDQTRANLANAVLRRVLDLGQAPLAEDYYCRDHCAQPVFLSRWYSCPLWLTELWLKDYGPDLALELLAAQVRPPLNGLRLNQAAPGARDLFARLTGLDGCRYASWPALAFDPASPEPNLEQLRELEAKGLASRQSAAVSAMLGTLGLAAWPQPIWDCCCGRGGKTLALLEQGREVWASDTNLRRLRGLGQDLERLSLPNIPIFRADGANPPLSRGPGTILVDAPCTGLGVLSRRPDAKWKRSLADIPVLVKAQQRLLAGCATALPPGGRLVYLTCTANQAENEAQAQWFAVEFPNWRKVAMVPLSGPNKLGEWFWGAVWAKPDPQDPGA